MDWRTHAIFNSRYRRDAKGHEVPFHDNHAVGNVHDAHGDVHDIHQDAHAIHGDDHGRLDHHP